MESVSNDAKADSSPAPLSSTDFLETLSDGERQKFFEATPDERRARMSSPDSAKPAPKAKPKADAKTSDATAESSPAPAEGQTAASTDASLKADSEPAAPKTETKGLDAREQEIRRRQAALKDALAETERLEREIAERQSRLRTPPQPTQDAPAESSPAAVQKAFEKYQADPRAPKLDQFETYDAWAMEMMDFISDRKIEARETEARQRSEQHAKERELNTAISTTRERVKAFAEKTPDFATRAHPELLNIVPLSALKEGDPIGPHNFIAEQMWRSEYPGELVLHFSEHPEEFSALLGLNNPAEIVRRIGRIEARFVAAPEATSADVPAPKTIPDADELPVLVGKKPAVTVSDTESALKSKDFAAYERAWRRERGLKD